ncbi:hypothetical protein [Sphingomonas montana]|uniref:hypothetical protein n=1 Tax=Sphingomonas montana TaxID=1843236 RepID=UPI00101AE4DF|nr:hypothetical protein [Sphingomonas montana]
MMPGTGIKDLRRPKKCRSPVGMYEIETKPRTKLDDPERAQKLRKTAAEHPNLAPALLELADRLGSKSIRRRQTLASRQYMRKHRIRIGGELWRLYDLFKQTPRTFTLMPAGLTFAPYQLAGVDPRRLNNQVRADLNRAGAGSADGWMLLCLDGEHDLRSGLFHIHFHGLAQGGMLEVLDRLRKQRRYKPQPVSLGATGKTTPVYICRKPLTDLPKPLTYIVKSYWPSRARGLGDSGTRVKPRPQRIPEPAHSQWLLWIDQWRLKDIILLVKLRVVNGRLVPR